MAAGVTGAESGVPPSAPNRGRSRSADAAEQRADPLFGWRMAAEQTGQAAARERLDDEHVRRGRIGLERYAARHCVDLAERIREAVRVARDLGTGRIGGE